MQSAGTDMVHKRAVSTTTVLVRKQEEVKIMAPIARVESVDAARVDTVSTNHLYAIPHWHHLRPYGPVMVRLHNIHTHMYANAT